VSAALDLVGTYRLVSMEHYTEDGTVGRPFGDAPSGFITYTAEGYMMALLSRSDRQPFADGDIMGGSPQEQIAAFLTASAFAGRYEIREQKIWHHLEAATFPNWAGTVQVRDYELTETSLALFPPPLLMDGQMRTSRVAFTRLAHWATS
jgi:hypothetical protein